jgi:hypothetical protein
MFSSFMTDLEMKDCRDLGAHDCLSKTCSFENLCELLKAVFQK